MALKDKLQEYAFIAEVISAIAIVTSLIFVGLEIRSSSDAAYQISYDNLLADHSNFRQNLALDEELSNLLYIFNSTASEIFQDRDISEVENWELLLEEHSPADIDRVMTWQTAQWQIFERAYFAYTFGRLSEESWSRYQKNICNPSNLGAIQVGELELGLTASFSSTLFSDSFWQYAKDCITSSSK